MNMFTQLFPHVRMVGRGVNGQAAETAENVARECGNRTMQAWIGDRPYELKAPSKYTKGKPNKLLEQMIGAFYGDSPNCIFTIGYFQVGWSGPQLARLSACLLVDHHHPNHDSPAPTPYPCCPPLASLSTCACGPLRRSCFGCRRGTVSVSGS